MEQNLADRRTLGNRSGPICPRPIIRLKTKAVKDRLDIWPVSLVAVMIPEATPSLSMDTELITALELGAAKAANPAPKTTSEQRI